LIGNAIKYSPENSTIHFRIENNDNMVIFEVSDEGMGIPEKDQKHIFERYFRAENALLNQGTGIGLNIVKVHVENMGGKIYFTSEESKGSTFTVQLPNYER
ncbi:MAG: sensor histidine kinase, partial [Christiangramia sp.]|nr:sensor histidine kinase [Christiangramia sp.]